jgi:hypothetical protein
MGQGYDRSAKALRSYFVGEVGLLFPNSQLKVG